MSGIEEEPTAAPPVAPEGVRIQHADGRVTPCSVTFSGHDDAGMAIWTAAAEGKGAELAAGDRLLADVLPARSALRLYCMPA